MISSGTRMGRSGGARATAFPGAQPFSYRPYWDQSALTYLQAINTSGAQIPLAWRRAINKWFKWQRAYGNLDKFEIFYLYVGGTAKSHAINGKNPGTFNVTWNGSITHNANGVTGSSGSANYGNTGWLPSVNMTVASQNSTSIGTFYRKTPAGVATDIGCSNGASILAGGGLYFGLFGANLRGVINNTVTGGTINPINNGPFLTSGNRPRNGVLNGLKNGTIISTHSVASAAPIGFAVYVAAGNFLGTAAGSPNSFSFHFIGSGAMNQRILADSLNLLQAKLGRI